MMRVTQILLLGVAVGALAQSPVYFDDALTLYDNEQWEEAYEAFQVLAEQNPHNGFFVYRCGSTAFQLKRYEDAIRHYKAALALNERVPSISYFIARCYALLGQAGESMRWLDRAAEAKLAGVENNVLGDEGFDPIRNEPAYLARFPSESMIEATPREARWRLDLAYLDRRIRQTHVNPFAEISERDWNGRIESLSQAVPELSDGEVMTRIQALIAAIGDGHTFLFPPREGPLARQLIPVIFYQFGEDIYVLRAATEGQALVGGQVTRIGKVPIAEAVARLRPLVSVDNDMGYAWLLPRYLAMADLLHNLGLTEQVDAVPIEVVDSNNQVQTATIKVVGWDQLPSNPAVLKDGWIDARADDAPLPLWQKHPGKNIWMEPLADTGLLYVQFNQVMHSEEQRLDEFADAMVEAINGNDAIRGLIIDCRNNSGGNNFLLVSMLQAVPRCPKINQRGRLFVITGRNTFSACQNFVNRLAYLAEPVFVGEPTGSSPNFVGETNQIRLPYSGLTISASSRTWQDSVSDDMRPWVAPHISAPPSIETYRRGIDPALEAITAYWHVRQQAANPSP